MKKSFGFGKFLISLLAGAAVSGNIVNYVKNKKLAASSKKVDKFKQYYNLLNQWLIIKNKGKSFEQYFLDHGYHTIAVYGMGEIGSRLYEELKNSRVVIKYAIDKDAGNTYSEVKAVKMDEELEPVDVIVVSAVFAMDEIHGELEKKVDCPIISLADAVNEILYTSNL